MLELNTQDEVKQTNTPTISHSARNWFTNANAKHFLSDFRKRLPCKMFSLAINLVTI